MGRFLYFIALAFATACPAQQLIPHNWPDTATSGGSVSHMYRFCDASGNVTDQGANIAGVTAAPLIPYGSVFTYGLTGYDPTSTNNCSILMGGSTSGFAAASSTTMDFNWNQPFSVEMQTGDYLGATALFTKNVGGSAILTNVFSTATNGFACYASDFFNTGFTTITCAMSATLSSEGAGGGQAAFINSALITPSLELHRNYDIVVINNGSGVPNQLQLWINGQAITWTSIQETNTGGLGGLLSVTMTAGGTGYSNSFTPTFSGGGGNCLYPTATATASGGVVGSVALSGSTHGCVGTVTISFASGGGTGATGTVNINPASLSNSATFSLGDTYGGDFPEQLAGLQVTTHALSAQEVQQRFAATDWYRGVLPAKPTTPQLWMYNNDIGADSDSMVSMALLLRLHQMGYVKLLLAVDSESSANAIYCPQMNQLFLNRAGMNQVPVGQSNTSGGAQNCQLAVQGVTGAPLITRSNYVDSTIAARTVLAAAAPSSIVMSFAAGTKPLADLNASPADGISPLTGKQLIAAKVSAIYQMGGVYPTSGGSPESNFSIDPASTGAEFDLTTGLPFATVPLNLYGFELGNAVITPPGTFNIYPTTAPIYQMWCSFLGGGTSCLATPGGDNRASWDSMAILGWAAPALFTPSANGTVTINASTGDDTWSSSSANNQVYHEAVSNFTLQSLIASILWSDPAIHSVR